MARKSRAGQKSQTVRASGTSRARPRPRKRMKDRRSVTWNSRRSSERAYICCRISILGNGMEAPTRVRPCWEHKESPARGPGKSKLLSHDFSGRRATVQADPVALSIHAAPNVYENQHLLASRRRSTGDWSCANARPESLSGHSEKCVNGSPIRRPQAITGIRRYQRIGFRTSAMGLRED